MRKDAGNWKRKQLALSASFAHVSQYKEDAEQPQF